MMLILKWKEFLQFKLGKSIIPNWQRQLDSLLKCMTLDATTFNKNSVEEIDKVCEEWMCLAQRVAQKI